MFCDNFEGWREQYPEAGTTVLIVVFSQDYQSYMVVKLGDSYVLQIPQGLQQNASAYAFNSTAVRNQSSLLNSYSGQIHYRPSMSSLQLVQSNNFKSIKFKKELAKSKFQELYGAKIQPKGELFVNNSNKQTLRTLSIDPYFFKSEYNIRKVFENFTKYGIFQRNPGELLIIASDGLPIQDGRIWRIINSESELKQYFSAKDNQDRDDFTVVIIN